MVCLALIWVTYVGLSCEAIYDGVYGFLWISIPVTLVLTLVMWSKRNDLS